MLRLVFAGGLLLFSCGPGPGTADAGPNPSDAFVAADLGTDAGGDGNSCDGVEEGTFTCGGYTRQCCGGVWRSYNDGPCYRVDAGPNRDIDAGPPSAADCANGPRPGCACPTEDATHCRAFDTTLRCAGGTWTPIRDVACCPF